MKQPESAQADKPALLFDGGADAIQRPLILRAWISLSLQYGSPSRSMVTPRLVDACMKKSPRMRMPTW